MRTLLLTMGVLASQAAPALAADLGPAEVGELVVTPTRSSQPADRIGAQITVIDSQALAARQAVVVTDLLAQTPGVTWSRNGGVGGATQVRIRGAETDQTVVLIDGVKLNDPSSTGGGYNFGNLMIGDIDRIEVLRGPQSVLWGSQAIGGVVNMITARPREAFEASVLAEGGSRETGYLRAGLGGMSRRLSWRVGAGHYSTAGLSAFARSRGGREADGYRNTGASGRAELTLSRNLSLDLRAVYSRGRVEFDGFPPPAFSFADTREFGPTEDFVGYGGLNLALFGGRLKNRFGYAHTATDRQTFNPDQAVSTTFDAQGRNRRWEYQGTLAISEGWSAVFGAEQERSRLQTASPSSFNPNPTPARASARLEGVYAQLQGRVAPGLTLTGGLRREDHNVFGGKTVAQAAAAWSLGGGRTVLRASYGEGFKAPTLFQLFSEFGNTALNPESARGWDVGAEHRLFEGRLLLSGAYFARRTTNQIDFVSCFGVANDPTCVAASGLRRSGYYNNTAAAEADGVELQAVARPSQGLTISANYTHTRAENDSPGSPNRGKSLQRRPADMANLDVAYLWPSRLSTAVSLRRAGHSFDDAANRNRIEGYSLIELRVSYPVRTGVEAYGRVENLIDETYETVRNYGQPGRGVFVGVRARY